MRLALMNEFGSTTVAAALLAFCAHWNTKLPLSVHTHTNLNPKTIALPPDAVITVVLVAADLMRLLVLMA